MPQGLSNAPATFNRCAANLLRSVREFAPITLMMYSSIAGLWMNRRMWNCTDSTSEKFYTLMRKHKLYANLKKCIFAASEIPLLGCMVGKHGVRPDPEKIKAITDWSVPTDIKGLRKLLGVATYLHKYSHNYAEATAHLSRLLKKNEKWAWSTDCQRSFEDIKQSLIRSPVWRLQTKTDHFMRSAMKVILPSDVH